jgi:ubiquinone/menaquinone biosynthesis C-methylase UbiE
MMQLATDEADRTLKAKHRAMWAMGDYPTLAAELIAELGTTLVSACGIAPGDRVLDVAAGSGNAAIPAARLGARVVASDLTPELLERGRQEANKLGTNVDWREADAEAMPFEDAEFDHVISCVGVMFAPHHQISANELVRVCRPGGTIGLIGWTPEGYIGQMFSTMKPYQAPPPPGAMPPPLWGNPDHVRTLLGDHISNFIATRRTITVDHFATATAFRDYFKSHYGPTIATYNSIAGDPDKVTALDRDLVDLARRHDRGTSSTVLDWEYLLVIARRK